MTELREVTRAQLEYQEARHKAGEWRVGAAIALIFSALFLVLAPCTFFLSLIVGVPIFIVGIIALCVSLRYDGEARRWKEKL